MFDVAGGKPVEVPAGMYEVIFGRVLTGKGARTQMATIYRGDSEPFEVKAGEEFDLEMGSPFRLDYEREEDGGDVLIHGAKIRLLDKSGAQFSNLQGAGMELEVV